MPETGALAWFRKPTPTDEDPHAGGTLNVAFQLLDRAVIAGASDETVLVDANGELSHVALLELVAAFGGVLRGFGVQAGDRVAVEVVAQRPAVVALLAAARIGAVGVVSPAASPEPELLDILEATRPRVVVTGDDRRLSRVLSGGTHRPDAVVATTAPATRNDTTVPWDAVMRAGRTDPAPAVALPAGAPSLVVVPRSRDGIDHATLRTTLEQSTRAAELAGALPLATTDLLDTLFGEEGRVES